MRRTLPALFAASLLIAACGDDDSANSGSTSDTVADETDSTEAVAGIDGEAGDDSATETDATEPGETDAAETATDYPEKPEVEIPAEPPTELVVTPLIEGSGPEAESGDTIIVDYVGVRSVDGEEFDASYNRQTPFPITLGTGAVIDGWEQGLEGVQQGDRIRLDIPSDLAYGAEARSELIRENEDLTFVIDVRSIIPASDATAPADAGVEASEGVSETVWEDIEVGDGDTLEEGDTAVFHFVLYQGDNLQPLTTSWETEPVQLTMDEEAVALEGMLKGMLGMKVGGRRAIIIPPEEGFGPEGNPQFGLPADTDIVLVVDLLGVY